jgi:NADH-quinone oxidoreductase subunit N
MELTNIVAPTGSWAPLTPHLILGALMVLAFVLELFREPSSERRSSICLLAPLGVLAALFWVVMAPLSSELSTMNRMIVDDGVSRGSELVILTSLLLGLVAVSADVLVSGFMGEYVALMLGAALGMILMATAQNLMIIFLGLELFSLALYLLCIFLPERRAGQEAALKYFMLSSLASAIILYGSALLYGATGSTWLNEMAMAVPTSALLWRVGSLMVLAGLAFKISAVPFHQWTPDVYQGAPTSVTAFMSVATKTAALVAALRIFPFCIGSTVTADAASRNDWMVVVFVLSILSVLFGNLAAMAQTNLKRMLAYSGVAQAGYLLTAVFAGTPLAAKGMLFYLFVYAFMNIGVFVAILDLESEGLEPTLQNVRGLSSRHPALAAAMSVCLISLTGVPLTGGFLAKFNLFQVVLRESTHLGMARALVTVAIVGSFLGACYYMRVVAALYSHAKDYQSRRWNISNDGVGVALAICVAGVLVTGVCGQTVLTWVGSMMQLPGI